MCMRLDYVMYIIAGLFFIVTIVAAVSTYITEMTTRQLWIMSTVVLGLISIGFGYFQRPKAIIQTSQPNATTPKVAVTQTIQAPAEPVAVVETTATIESTPQSPTSTETTSNMPVTHVKRSQVKRIKGIGQKRAAQLNALGINSYVDLANASAADVAKSLQISPKTVKKWITEAEEKIR